MYTSESWLNELTIAINMGSMDLDALLAVSLPLLLTAGITLVTWLFVRRRHRREREQKTFRPPLFLRIAGIVVAFLGAIFLAVGLIQITAALSAGEPLTDDALAQAIIGAVLLLTGLFVWLKNSTRLTLGADALSYSKCLVVKGAMNYRDIESVRATQTNKVWNIRLRESRTNTLDMPERSADWGPLIEWALANHRPDISNVFMGEKSFDIPMLRARSEL